MDLFALGTPVIDKFAKASFAELARLGLEKGATNYMDAERFSAIERLLGDKITCSYPGDNARNVCEGFAALGGFCGFQGAVGDDRAGAEFAANLAECGIASFLQVREGSTGKMIVLVTPDSDRTFCAELGVSAECDAFESLALSQSRMFFATTITLAVKPIGRLAMRYLEAAKKQKKPLAKPLTL